VPISQQDDLTIARVFVEQIILKFGIPQILLTDQGSNFLSELFANVRKLLRVKRIKTSPYHPQTNGNVRKLLRVKRIKTSPYHPQTNGALEKTHRVLVEYLRCYILENQTDWNKWIPYATFLCLIHPHSSTGFTPHELLFGRKPNIPGILQKETPEIRYNYESYVQEIQPRLQSCYEVARSNLRSKKEKSKEYYDRNTNVPLFAIGEKVLLHDEKVRRSRSAKLTQPYIGPYEIIAFEDVNVTLKLLRNKTLKVHANRLKPFFG